MTDKYKIDVICDWSKVSEIKEEWNDLNSKSGVSHPFTTYEWFDCWYKAYSDLGNVRIILVRDKKSDNIRAILPGILIKMREGRIALRCFSYASNGHSPRCGIISKKDDIEAAKASIAAIWDHLEVNIDLATLMSIDTGSPTQFILNSLELPHLYLHVEHSFESPAFNISSGWGDYLRTRSKKFRQRIRQGRNRAERFGKLTFNIILNDSVSEQDIERLKNIDSKTWQYKEGSGLYSTNENEIFYNEILKTFGKHRQVTLCFLKIGDSDVAYEIATSFGSTAFFLKYGYDPEFNKCSPGLLIQSYLAEYYSSLGFREVDLLGDMSKEKEHWDTHLREHRNYWIINRKSIRGKILYHELLAYGILKKLFGKIIKDKSNIKIYGNSTIAPDEEI